MEIRGNGFNAEDEQEKIQRIHRPAQESSHKRVPLEAGEAPEVVQNGHLRENSRKQRSENREQGLEPSFRSWSKRIRQ